MASLADLERAWNAAQPRLSAIRDWVSTTRSPKPRILRVGQLDSELLDQELVQLLREPVNKALSLINATLKSRFDAELTLLIQLTLYKLSIWNTGASYGAKLQDLRYVVPPSPDQSLAPSGIPRRILYIHGTLSAIIPYLHTKFRSHALSSAWPDVPSSDHRRKAWDILTTLESSYTLLSLANFVTFLWTGRFRTIADRLLKMSLVPSSRMVKRDISYEFMNRQMVWHAFTEFLIFLLPLINTRGARRRINRIAKMVDLSNMWLSMTGKTVQNIPRIIPEKGKYWSLPQDQCAICAENASFNLNLSESSNAFSSLVSAAPVSVHDSTADPDTEVPAFPIYNPYMASCGDIYCYHCIAERMVQIAEAGEDVGWECLRCRKHVTNAERYTVEMEESDVSESDYGFSSDISASMGSYSESGWSDDHSI